MVWAICVMKKKTKKERKVIEPPLNPCCKKNFLIVQKLFPKYSFIVNITTFFLKMYSIRPVKKIGYKLEKTCKQAVIFFIKHLNIILQAKI